MFAPLRGCLAALALASLVHNVSSADAAQLSMRFSSGDSEITLAPNGTAEIEIVWTMAPAAKTARNLGALNNRFDVTGTATIEVTEVTTSLAGWDVESSSGMGGPLADLFASAAGTGAPITETATTFETVVQTIAIRNVDGTSGTVEIAFRANEVLPDAITSTGGQWILVAASPAAQQFDISNGSPGYTDLNGADNPASPLLIHLTGTGGGGGGGGDPSGDPNDNSGAGNLNDNTSTPLPNDNSTDGANDNTGDPQHDNTSDNDGGDDPDPDPNNANTADPDDQDNTAPDPGDNASDPGDPPPVDSEDPNDNIRPPSSGGGRSTGACGLGLIVPAWTLAALLALRLCRCRR